MHSPDHADVLFLGGRVWTGLDQHAPVDSVAVRDGRISAMGLATDLAWTRGPGTRVVPLAGRWLLPAFQDAHVHPLLAGLGLTRCWLSDAPADPDAYLGLVAAYAAAHPERPWILGEGWSMSAFPGGLAPAALLDAVVGDRPACIESRDGHSAWVNSAALALAGITRETPDPVGGRIERDADGAPMGTLQERAIDLVARLVPPATAEEHEAALLRGQAELHRLGIGTWQDAHVDPARQAAYMAVAGRGELTGRAAVALLWDVERGPEQGDEVDPARLRAPSVKLFQDGVMESATAALLEPYLGATALDAGPDGRGESIHDPEVLRTMCTRLDAEHFAVHAHAIGDRAVREVLDALTAARRANGPRDARHQVAHLQLVDPEDLPRFRALGVIANCQPYWAFEDGYLRDLTRPALGDARVDRMYPFGSLARMGATLAFGSDWSVTTPDPLRIIGVAMRRLDPDEPGGEPLGPLAERLSLDAALRAATRGAALANGFDDRTGTIETGRAADLVLLDGDPVPEPGRTAGTGVLMTMVEGRAVWESPELDA